MADFGHGAGPVVGHAVDHDGDTARTVALVANFLELVGARFATATLDGAFDGVLGHVGGQRLVQCQTQAWIGARIATAGTRGDRDFTNQLGKNLTALLVLGVLAVLNVRPFAVAGHAIYESD